jgi:hypothetical protein
VPDRLAGASQKESTERYTKLDNNTFQANSMKRFLAFFASSLMLVVGVTLVTGAEQDVTGFEAYLASTLPHTSVPLLVSLCLIGLAYSIASGILFDKTLHSRMNNRSTSYLAGIAFGAIGLPIAYAAYAIIPSYDTFASTAPLTAWLVAGIQMVLALAGIFFPAISALAHAVAIPMGGAMFAMYDWATKESYRSKRAASGNKVMQTLRRLCSTV